MEKPEVQQEIGSESRRAFMRALLRDLRALERMLGDGLLERGVRRLGAEQEMFLVDPSFHPAPAAMDILQRANHPAYTTELGLFNLEFTLDPLSLSGDCLSRLERALEERLAFVRGVAAEIGVEVILTGILPTLRKSDLGLENMTPIPRYQLINQAMTALRGGDYEITIKGLDELMVRHDSVMLESCNTSFQVHLQVDPEGFANSYNIAQALAGPVLSAAANSPLLFGRRLWAETRIALFQHAVDTRRPAHHLREVPARVNFGNAWVKKGVVEIYREDIMRFRTLVSTESDEDPLAALARGQAPELKALRLHNGTVYRWNRACYGITAGRPHLRIENRVFPAGPSVPDEVANAALWLGLMVELAARHEDFTTRMEFEHAKHNFVSAAREGLGAHLVWLDGEEFPAQKLLLEHLLPAAGEGLARAGCDRAEVAHYMTLLEERVSSGRTGSRWMIQSLAGMKGQGTAGERMNALAAATLNRQRTGAPISRWELASLDEAGGWRHNYLRVEQFMTTDFYTVYQDDPVEFVAHLMEWQRVRHVPVEDHDHRLVGLVSYRAVLRLMAHGGWTEEARALAVSEIMKNDPVTVSPQLPTLRAIGLMRELRVGCLPVVQDGRLVGVVTEDNFMEIAGQLLEQKLRE